MKPQALKTISRKASELFGEADWNAEVSGLRKLAIRVWQELKIAESVYCLDVKDRIDLTAEVRNLEITLIKQALLQTGGNQARSAKLLGLSASSLNAKIKRYGIRVSHIIHEIALAE